MLRLDEVGAVALILELLKGIHSAVAGEADILLVPDLEAGNMLAKQLAYLGRADSASIVLGTRAFYWMGRRAKKRMTSVHLRSS